MIKTTLANHLTFATITLPINQLDRLAIDHAPNLAGGLKKVSEGAAFDIQPIITRGLLIHRT
jgi:hypothetical protein